MNDQAKAAAGLYVHVPFCLTRCGYCDFNTYTGLDHLKGRYLQALTAEADMSAPAWAAVPFASVFFGGGTPTTLPPGQLVKLLDYLRVAFDVGSAAEVTVEANPDTVDHGSLAALVAGGVTRVSLGVQSFDPTVLVALERIHGPDAARAAVGAARRAGVTSLNLDLIYGAEGESIRSWGRTLDEAIALEPDHLSCYGLTIEAGTALGAAVAAGRSRAPDVDLQAEMYDLACDRLGAVGFEHYEVSNWARPGHRSRHNLGYWEGRPYLGLGAGAHSHRDDHRWWNVRPVPQYLAMVVHGRPPLGGEEYLSRDERRLERLLLGLRATVGVPLEWIDEARVAQFVEEGLARRRDGRLTLTDRGMLLANDIVTALV